jgi:hypothetical protein
MNGGYGSQRRQGLEGLYSALDRAFVNRISRIFDSMCDTFEEEHATALFQIRYRR